MSETQQSSTDGQPGQKFTQTVHRLKSELDRFLEVAWTRGEEVWGQIQKADAGLNWSPEIDMVETDDSILVFVNLPGLAGEQIELNLVGNVLELTAHVEPLTLQPSDRIHKRERPAGVVRRAITLPVTVDNESATAHSEHGVLKIEIRKSVNMRAHKVPVVVSSSNANQSASQEKYEG